MIRDIYKCIDCGEEGLVYEEGSCVSACAYRREDNATVCASCATKREQSELLGANKALGYISSDFRRVTTFIGGDLMTINSYRRRSPPFGRRTIEGGWEYYTIHATDVHGQHWVGQGAGPHIYATFRRIK